MQKVPLRLRTLDIRELVEEGESESDEVKTEEKDPLQPKVEAVEDKQADEMDQYSDKVKKRIVHRKRSSSNF